MSYWPTPAQKAWFAVYVDGSCIGIFPDSAAGQREKARLSGLKGIDVRFASSADFIKFRACTKLSSRILKTMSEKSVCYRWKPKFAKEFLRVDSHRSPASCR